MSKVATGWNSRFPGEVLRPTFREYEVWLDRRGRKTPAVAAALARAQEVIARHCYIAYIAGPLTDVAREFKERYERAAALCEANKMFGYAPHLHGTDPVKHPEVFPEEVRDIDFLWAVVMPHFHINFLYPIGHGNAIEAGWAEAYQIPALFCAPLGFKLSRLTKGLLNVHTWVRYKDHEDLNEKLEEIIKKIKVPIIS